MRSLTTILIGFWLALVSPRLVAGLTQTNTFGNLNAPIPSGDPAGLASFQTVTSAITNLTWLRVSLCVVGDFNGDLYGYVRHVQGSVTNFCVLLNRPGRNASNPWGYADCGFNVLFDDASPQGDVHIYETVTNPPAGSPVAGPWQPDGRDVDPSVVLDTTPRATNLSSFSNSDPNGEWTLFLADMSYGSTNLLVSWAVVFSGPALPPISWSTPANLVYGTALGAAQLNASSSVPGVFTYNPPAGTVLNAGSQVLSVTFYPTDTNTYVPLTTNVPLVVLPGALTITAANANKLYGAALPAFTASYIGFVHGDSAASLTPPPALSTTATAASPVGSYPITASGAASPNYTISYASGTLTVSPAPLTITAANASKLYGAALPALTASYSGFVNGDTISSLTTPAALSTTATAAYPVGSYTITVSGAASPNYTISYASGTLTINAAALTITAVSTNKLYGAALPALTASYGGFVNGDTASSLTTLPTLSTTATAASPVGSYPITASGAASPNYTISYANGTLTVNKAVLTITAANAGKLYGAALPTLTAGYSGFANGDTPSSLTTPPVLTTTATAASPVGSYPITASGAASPNYTISYANGTLTVNKAVLTITAANASKLYAAALPTLTAGYSGFVNGDTASSLTTLPALSTTATVASPVGSYPITTGGAASPNYTISYANGTLTVNQAALTITAANASKLYGAALPTLTAGYSGFVNGDTPSSLTTPPTLSTTATAASPAGTYWITASGAASPNYTISYANGTLTVNKAALTISAANAGKLYGAALPTLTAGYSGFVNGDTPGSLTTPPALTTTATAASPVGSYPITAGGAASPNYTISYANGTLTVNQTVLAITAANASKLYGAALPALTANYSGFVNGDTPSSLTTPPTLSTTATAASPAGTYWITASGAASPNYTISYANGTLAVNKAALTITAANASKLYSAALPTLTASYSGFVNGDTPSTLTTSPALSTTATAASPVGSYPITASGAASPNYAINYAGGVLTISPGTLTITAANASKLYGAALPTLTANYSGFVNGDTPSSLTTPPTLSTTATAASPAGTYWITASGAASPNYTISYANGTLAVNKAALTITAANASKLYGAALPTLTASYSGFVNGDTPSTLTTPPALSTTATAASPVGSYPITASGAASPNYAINYAGGVLTISPAALTITAANASKLYGAALPTLTANYSGLANGDTPGSLTTPPALSTTATAASPVGTYWITASGAASPNYTISYANGTLAVNKAALTITAANASKLYGMALPTLTASYSGFVNGDTPSTLTTPPALSTTATAASPVGSYPITASGAASPNYTISYASGTLTVTPAALTITAANASKLYGAAVPTLTAAYSGFGYGDTLPTPPALSTTATAASPVGSYPITASGAASPNYTISYVSGTLTVSPAALTITAANASKLYGAAVPALTAGYSGFVNGDAPGSLTAAPALTTTATPASPVGSYPITASGAAGANYTFMYIPGSLVVTKASTAGLLSSSGNPSPPGQTVTFTVSLSAVAPGAGTPTGTVQFEVDGAAAGAPVSLSGGTASYTATSLAHGSHTVAGQYAGDANFLGTTGLLSAPQVIDSPPVAGPVTLYRDLSSGLQVTIANLLTNVSALAGDTVTLAGVSAASANGGTVATNNGWVFYTPAPGFTNTDTFTYLVTDGWTAPVAGTVTVEIVAETGPSRNLDIKNLGNGSVAVEGQGIPGATYIIQYTTSPLPTSNWLTLGTVTADSSGAFVLVDTGVSGLRFYRALCP